MDFLTKCDQIPSFLRIWSHLLEKPLMENFIFCAVTLCANKLEILKVSDLIHLQNCLLMNQLEQYERLAKSFSEFKRYGNNHNY